jgi:hypothetical protein
MRYPKFTASRSHLIPLAALLLTTTLGGCYPYSGYPSNGYGHNYPNGYPSNGYGHDYSNGYPANYGYNYPNGYHAVYLRTPYNSNESRPFYSPDYNGTFNTHGTGGGGG